MNAATVRILASVCSVAMFGAALPSAVQAHEPPSDVAAFTPELSVTLTGRIEDRCSISGGGTMALGELTPGEGATADFSLDCNVPFELGLSSPRGGLAHATMPQGQGPFAGTLPYSVRVEVPVISPQPSMLDRSFDSRDLRSRRTMNSGEAIAAGGARLTFKTDTPSGAGLLAGDDSETLTVTVTAL